MVYFEAGIILTIFLVPIIAYLSAWALSSSPVLFPRPLYKAKEILLVVAHPDDECSSPFLARLIVALFFAPCLLRSLWSAGAQGSVLVLSAGM